MNKWTTLLRPHLDHVSNLPVPTVLSEWVAKSVCSALFPGRWEELLI